MTRRFALILILCISQIAWCKPNILIYSKNGKGYVHKNISTSIACLKKICEENHWDYTDTNDASIFTADKIVKFDALVFTNTNNETFDTQAQKDAFQNYIQNGGSFVGIHSVCGSERQWPWFWANLGGKFVRHPKNQDFDIKIIDHKHASTAHLDPVWNWADECYFLNELNPGIQVLLAADLRTVDDEGKKKYPGRIYGDYFPLAWYQHFDGGHQWYTALGHNLDHYQDPNFVQHLEGGIRWAIGQ